MVYFSVTFMVAMRVSLSVSQRATSSPGPMESASALLAERVMGMGQKRPFLVGILNSSQTPFQSA